MKSYNYQEYFKADKEELKREIQKLTNTANKRLTRLENNNLTGLPAYRNYADGGRRFGVKGKSYNELQQELSRITKFLNDSTSLVRESNKLMKKTAENIKLAYTRVSDLPNMLKNYFELVGKAKQYLRTTSELAHALNYEEIWKVVNDYVQTTEIDLTQAQFDGEVALQKILDLGFISGVEQAYNDAVGELKRANWNEVLWGD